MWPFISAYKVPFAAIRRIVVGYLYLVVAVAHWVL
jgi:hypothetical protein